MSRRRQRFADGGLVPPRRRTDLPPPAPPAFHASAEPVQVEQSRERLLRGERLPDGGGVLRPYYCRGCGQEVRAVWVPRGWYQLARATGEYGAHTIRLGLYCSVRCLGEQMPRLVGIDDALGETFDGTPPSIPERRPADGQA